MMLDTVPAPVWLSTRAANMLTFLATPTFTPPIVPADGWRQQQQQEEMQCRQSVDVQEPYDVVLSC
jgi:hypothetical protein